MIVDLIVRFPCPFFSLLLQHPKMCLGFFSFFFLFEMAMTAHWHDSRSLGFEY